MRLSAPVKGNETGEPGPQKLGGDFDATEWTTLFTEWIQGGGRQELVDPDIPQYALGSSLGKFLFVPGFYIPSILLPPGTSRFRTVINWKGGQTSQRS